LKKTKKEGNQVKFTMNRNVKIAAMLTILVATALASYFWAITNTPIPTQPFDPFGPRRFPFGQISGDRELFTSFVADIELYYTLQTVLSAINATLLVFLMITYIDIYKKVKSEFTFGLIIFSMILLLYALVSNPLMHSIFGFRAIGLGPFAMLPDLFTFLALSVLLYLTMK
jgi:hypothetical protein